jgi:hypothetical protein
LDESLTTVAVNCWVAPTGTVTLAGEITIAIPGTLIVAEAMAFPFTEVAVSVTVKSPNPGAV